MNRSAFSTSPAGVRIRTGIGRLDGSPLVVLKFGGSVLTNESTLRRAVHEIYRGDARIAALWRWFRRWPASRTNCSAVVGESASGGAGLHRGDGLQRRIAKCRHAVAALGSRRRAGLGAHAGGVRPGGRGAAAGRHAGLSGRTAAAESLGPRRRGCCAGLRRNEPRGTTLRARPRRLRSDGALLAPWPQGDRCRLVKDVDGLYERDPEPGGPRPRRYATAAWSDALATDGSIVQHKAVRFAETHGHRVRVVPRQWLPTDAYWPRPREI